MLKKCEKILSALLFGAMFIFISQLEADILPFFIAFSGVVSCGALSVILMMHGADLHFAVDIVEDEAEVCPPLHEETYIYVPTNNSPSPWFGRTKAA